jgi:hypothetical protein
MTQDIPWENPQKGKTQPPKASTLHVLFNNENPLKYIFRDSMNTIEAPRPIQAIYVNTHESTHPMPCFNLQKY